MFRRAVVAFVCACVSSLLAFGVNPPPTLISISPLVGSLNGGTSVTLTGANFLSGATVVFGSAAAKDVVVGSSTTITALAPANPVGLVSVTVINPDGQTSAVMPLPNPGFESGSSGWVFGGTGSSGVVTNSAQAHSGQNFAQLVSPVAATIR